MGLLGRAHVERYYDWDLLTRELLDVYRDAGESNHRGRRSRQRRST